MTTVQSLLLVWTPLLAVVVVFLTSLFKVDGLSSRWNNVIAIALSAVGAVVAVWQSGAFNGLNNLTSIAAVVTLIYGVAQVFYQFILRGTKLDATLRAVRLTTKPKPTTVVSNYTVVSQPSTLSNVTLTAPTATVVAEPTPGA